MANPVLVVMAAGMGSRYGGLKQIDPVGPNGQIIMNYSIYDAWKAGFRRVVFIIKEELLDAFRERIGNAAEALMQVDYVFQSPDKLPEGCTMPEGRIKPLGTGHAVYCIRGVVNEPFAVINADDFYGPSAYTTLFDYLKEDRADNEHAMVAYELRKTVTENGSVARGICSVENGYLTDVVERTRIEKRGDDAAFTEDGVNFVPVSGSVPVSMNFWGFGKSMLRELQNRFPAWLDENLPKNPLKCEYFLPFVANSIIKEGMGSIRILNCRETWHGITYKEDMDSVVNYLAELRRRGVYPEALLD